MGKLERPILKRMVIQIIFTKGDSPNRTSCFISVGDSRGRDQSTCNNPMYLHHGSDYQSHFPGDQFEWWKDLEIPKQMTVNDIIQHDWTTMLSYVLMKPSYLYFLRSRYNLPSSSVY